MSTSSPYVAVGVDGAPGTSRTIEYAVQEARRASCLLRLVHVVPNFVPFSPMFPHLPDAVEADGKALLRQAQREAAEIAPDLTVERELRRGSRSGELARVSKRARLLVLGRELQAHDERGVGDDTGVAVAARASCPVVSVPPTWEPSKRSGAVVTGVTTTAQAAGALDHAFALAAATGARLVVLHSWKMPRGYDDLLSSRSAIARWNATARRDIDVALDPWRTTYPQVVAQVRVVHEHPVRALLDASRSADVVVLARRRHGVPPLAHLGRTARAVLRSGTCPVRVVPPPAAPNVLRGLELELSGTIRK